MYARARAIPADPGTIQQGAVRQIVAQLAVAWSATLTAPQRLAWNTYGAQVTLPDSFGDQRNVAGIAHYMRCNVPRMQASVARLDVAPVNFNLGAYTAPNLTTVSVATQLASIAFTNADGWASAVGGYMLVYLSMPQNPGINFFKGPYRFAGKITGAVAPPVSPQTFAVPWPVSLGQLSYAQLRVIQVDGRVSSPFRDSVLVTA
jgi:hypothetical protein